MIVLEGKYNKAKVFTDNVEGEAISQIIELCNQKIYKDSQIRIMPDVHAGAGCTIGTTMTVKDKICVNLVGVDIGCGMSVAILKEKEIDLKRLDKVIREYIPSGFDTRTSEHRYMSKVRLNDLKCKNFINQQRARLSLGTLGGGNHFIELCRNKDREVYLVVHSGSRYLGKQVAEHYQELAYKELTSVKDRKQEIIDTLKAQGKEKEIQEALKSIQPVKIKKELAHVEGQNFKDYINDMGIVQEYATYNRKAMLDEIVKQMGVTVVDKFTTTHNYIDLDNMILRKGAVSAQKGERLIVPMNMRDGSLICIGKGNKDWNCSVAHGAGRLYSRGKSKELITIEAFQESMNGIYSTSVCESTIDEAPMAYKPMDEIIKNVKDTVDIVDIIKPLYNFKAS